MMKFNANNSSLPDSLNSIIIRVFSKLGCNSDVDIKYGSGKFGDYVTVTLENEESIYINLSISNEYVDLILGKSKSPYFEMAKISRSDDLEKFEILLEKLLYSDIRETWYTSGSIAITKAKTNDVILKVSPILSYLWPKRIDKEWIYKSWI